MIKPKCDACGKEMQSFGGLLFSPPQKNCYGKALRCVDKFHICVECWTLLMAWLKEGEGGKKMSEVSPRPCPFCGCDEQYHSHLDDCMKCPQCGACGPDEPKAFADDVANLPEEARMEAMWNTRKCVNDSEDKDKRIAALEAQTAQLLSAAESKGLWTTVVPAEIEGCKQRIAELERLLALAKCPSCDGSGGIPVQVGDHDWDQEQCQWCFEAEAILAKKGE